MKQFIKEVRHSHRMANTHAWGNWLVELSCGHMRTFENGSCYPPSKAKCEECENEVLNLRYPALAKGGE